MTKKSNRIINITTVLLALLLLGIAAAPASAALNATKGAGNIVVVGANAQNAFNSNNETTILQITGFSSQLGSSIFVDLPSGSGVTYNTTASSPVAALNTSLFSSNNTGITSVSASITSSTRITVTITGIATSSWAINVSGIKVDVASTATAGNKAIAIDTGFATDNTAVLTVAKPTVAQIAVVNIPFGAGNATVTANIINISTTLNAVGEIGGGTYINVTLPSDSGITFTTNNPGNVTFAGSGGALTGSTMSNVTSDGLTLFAITGIPASSAAVSSVNFTGFGLNATTTAVNGTVAFNITLGNSTTSAYTQAVSNKINLTKPIVSALAQINLPLGNVNVSVPTNVINISYSNSSVAGEIGNGSFVNVTLPSGSGITFSTAINGSGNVTFGGSSASITGSTVANVTSNGLTLYAQVASAGASTTTVGYINFTGFTLNATTSAINGTKFNVTTTPMNASGSVTSQITLGINTTNVSLNLAGTATSNTIYTDANGNTTAGLGILTISTTAGVVDEIGASTNITISLPTYTGVSFNGSSRGNVTSTNLFFNFSNTSLNYAIPTLKNTTDNRSLTVLVMNSSVGTRSVLSFSGYNLSVTSSAPAGILNFTVVTTANGSNGTAINGTGEALTQNFNWGLGITIAPVWADAPTSSPSSSSTSLVVGTTGTFYFNITNVTQGMNFSGATVTFAVNNSAATLNRTSATSDSRGNVSVNVTVPETIGGFNLTVNVTGPDGFRNTTNSSVNVTIQSTAQTYATKLKILTDTGKIVPSQVANITVVAVDINGNNVTGITDTVQLASGTGVTINASGPGASGSQNTLKAGPGIAASSVAYFNVTATSSGSITLTATDVTNTSVIFATGTQTFVGDPVSINLTAASSSVANNSAVNLTASLRDASGTVIQTVQSITITSSNATSLGGINSATGSSVTVTTNSSGFATANFTANSAGTTGTAYANASFTNVSGYILWSNVSITVELGTLSVVASPTTVTAGTATSVRFNVTSSGSAVSGATVSLSGAGVTASDITAANGSVNITVSATGAGTITATATKTGYTSGTTSVTASTTTAKGNDTLGIYQNSTGNFLLKNSNSAGAADISFQFGPGGLKQIKGDFDGSGNDTAAVYNLGTGTFFWRNSNTAGAADATIQYGSGASDLLPVIGDWDGSGNDTIGLYNTTSGTFFLKNSNSAGAADVTVQYGSGGSDLLPVVGDWDGSGNDTIGLYKISTGTFLLKNSNSAGAADVTVQYGSGASDLLPVVGDWDGSSATDTIGLYNTTSGTFFLKNSNSAGAADVTAQYGSGGSGILPVVGDWDNQ